MSRFRLRPVLPSERALVYEWRKDPAVRRVMSNPHVVDQEVHKDWWQTAIADPQRRMMILDDADVPAALIVFFDLKPALIGQLGISMRGRAGSPVRICWRCGSRSKSLPSRMRSSIFGWTSFSANAGDQLGGSAAA